MQLKDLEFFQKMVWLIGFGVTVREVSRVEISKKLLSQQKNNETLSARVDILFMVAQNLKIHIIFWKS